MNSQWQWREGVILETARLRSATWEPDDWKPFRRLASDPLVVRYIGTGEPWTDGLVQGFVARQIANWREHRFCLWKLLEKETNQLIGICGLQPLAESLEVEIGWWLDPPHWGQGLATEAACRALVYGFEACKLERIVAIAQPANRASIHVMEKIGMSYERPVVHKGVSCVCYAVTHQESYRPATAGPAAGN
jgi:ribosomal-protein-alanine N-acetyltransferase